MEDDNDYIDEIEEVSEEMDSDEIIDNGYDGGFSYGAKTDPGVVQRIQSIRNTINNYGGPSDRKVGGNKGGGNTLNKKDGLSDKDEPDNKKSDFEKNSEEKSDSLTPKINDKSEKELGDKISEKTSNSITDGVKEKAAEKVTEKAKEQVAEKATEAVAKKTVGKSIKLVIIKYLLIGFLIFWGISLIVILFVSVYENLVGTISNFFGITEKTTEVNNADNYQKDGLLTDNKYQYYNKYNCNLDNYDVDRCSCTPGQDGCVPLTQEDLIKTLKSDNRCKFDSSLLNFWDGIVLNLNGGIFNDECRLLRYIRGAIKKHEKDYSVSLDSGLIVSAILTTYGSQGRNSVDTKNSEYVESTNHYEVLKDIAKDGVIKVKDVDNLIKSSILEDIYPYYTYENDTCVLKSEIGYKFSATKFEIYMRYGMGENNSPLGISDSNFSTVGYLKIGDTNALDSTNFSSESLLNLSGSGWVYERALRNAWIQTSEECREEEFFKDREITEDIDLAPYVQKVEDIHSGEKDDIKPATVHYRIGRQNKTATVNFDYRAGYVYNKVSSLKKAITEGKDTYDSIFTPKRAEAIIEEIFDRKKQINDILFFNDNAVDNFETPVVNAEFIQSNRYYWPIGSNQTTTSNGVTFASGAPANTRINSYYGKRKHPRTGKYKMHSGVDLDGKEGVTNVIAAQSGKVYRVKNGCTPGNYGCGGGYGNYIQILHPDGKYTFYAHLYKNSMTVSVGDEVAQGQVIAKVGNTGNSTGPHLHFEVRTSATQRVNPLDYISKDEPRPTASGNISGTTGKNNMSTVCLSLINSGMSKDATIALMINIQAESSFNPECNTREEDGEYSYGLFQWKGPKQKQDIMDFANAIGQPYNGINAQLNYVFYSMQHGGNRAKQAYQSLLSKTNSAKEKATDFCLLYERPKDKETHCPARVEKHYERISKFVKNGCE